MAAYVIVEQQIRDPVGLEAYKSLAAPTVAKWGGRYLARGGTITPLEGDWNPERMVVLEFPSAERARGWYDSPEYAEARRAREGAVLMKMVIIEGG